HLHLFSLMLPSPPTSPLFPYPTLFRSRQCICARSPLESLRCIHRGRQHAPQAWCASRPPPPLTASPASRRWQAPSNPQRWKRRSRVPRASQLPRSAACRLCSWGPPRLQWRGGPSDSSAPVHLPPVFRLEEPREPRLACVKVRNSLAGALQQPPPGLLALSQPWMGGSVESGGRLCREPVVPPGVAPLSWS